MGLFDRRTNKERGAIEQAFERFGVQEDQLASTLREGEFDLTLVFVRDEELDAVANLVAQVIDLALKHEAQVLSTDGSLVVLGMGIRPTKRDAIDSDARTMLAHVLAGALGDNGAILHGRFRGLVGTVGVDKRMSYTVLTKNWKAVVRAACEVEWGAVREWRPGA